MAQKGTFDFLVSHLCGKIEPSLTPSDLSDDDKPQKRKEARFTRIFRNWIYESGEGYFLLGGNGVLYVYNGRHYEMIDTDSFLRETVRKAMIKMKMGEVYCEFTFKKIGDDCMSGMENNERGKFEADRNYIVFNNGVFNVSKGTLEDFGLDKRTDLILDIDYDPKARNALWEEKLVEIIPNEQMRDALQMFAGSLLIDRSKVKIEYVCYLLGPGSNGKSVIAASIANVFGEKYFAKFEPKQLLSQTDSMFNMAELDGKIANFTDDLKKEDISGGQFKKFASGEKFPARHPYGRKVFYVAAPPLLCCANEMPPTTDDSWGHHRRQLPIYSTPVIKTEKDKDPMLVPRLASVQARQAIFNWIYEGYKKIMANGGNIALGEEVIEAQLAIRDDSNSVRRWIRDCSLVKVEDSHISDERWKTLSEWHKEYKEYCEENGDSRPQNAKSLSKLFREKGFPEKRGNKGMMFCIGKLDIDTNIDGNRIGTPLMQLEDENLPF